MMIKLKAALLTFLLVLGCFAVIGLIGYAVRFYGLHMLFAVSLSFLGALAGVLVYSVYSHILLKLKHGR